MRLRVDFRGIHRRARRFARRVGSVGYRTIVVPLLEREETENALDLACGLAADRSARVVLVAPLFVERELPLDARFDAEVRALRDRLDKAAAVAASYGVGSRTSAAPSSSSSARRSSRGVASGARSRTKSCSSCAPHRVG
jgi:hypothetical protein